MSDDHRTPWQADRDRAERTGRHPESWGPFHRHFANDAVHRDGGRECDQPGTPRRVYVFDPDYLSEHELIVARYAIAHPEQFTSSGDEQVTVQADDLRALLNAADTDYLSTENLPDLEERIDRLTAAAGLDDDEGDDSDD